MEDTVDLIYSTECLGAYSTEKALTAAQRKKLPTKIYGITRDKKFPLEDAAHVRSAMSYFNRAPERDKPALANKILVAARRYKIEYNDKAEWYKYSSEYKTNHTKK
jgi:hypothetical protein